MNSLERAHRRIERTELYKKGILYAKEIKMSDKNALTEKEEREIIEKIRDKARGMKMRIH